MYSQKLTAEWSVVVRQIHQMIKENFTEIQSMVNLLIGLTTIAIGLLMTLVMELLMLVIRMFKRLSVLRKAVDKMRREGSLAFGEVAPGVSEF